jgi:hypothetical protein
VLSIKIIKRVALMISMVLMYAHGRNDVNQYSLLVKYKARVRSNESLNRNRWAWLERVTVVLLSEIPTGMGD